MADAFYRNHKGGEVTIPELEHDAMMLRKYQSEVSPRMRLERRIVAALIQHLQRRRFHVVGVDDTDQVHVLRTPGDRTRPAMERVFAVDEAYLLFRASEKQRHYVRIDLGNGIDCIVDWSFTEGDADGFDACMKAFDPEDWA